MQKLIIENSLTKFRRDVNDHLEDGWVVVPGSLAVSVSSTTVSDGQRSTSDHICSVVLTDEKMTG